MKKITEIFGEILEEEVDKAAIQNKIDALRDRRERAYEKLGRMEKQDTHPSTHFQDVRYKIALINDKIAKLKKKLNEEFITEEKLSPADTKKKEVAIKTLRMKDVADKMVSGMTKEEAKHFLELIGMSPKDISNLETNRKQEDETIPENHLQERELGEKGEFLKKIGTSNKLDGLSFCITGPLEKALRVEYIKIIENNGGEYMSSVRKGLDYLITNDTDSGSRKNRAAKELGVDVINEGGLLALLHKKGVMKEDVIDEKAKEHKDKKIKELTNELYDVNSELRSLLGESDKQQRIQLQKKRQEVSAKLNTVKSA